MASKAEIGWTRRTEEGVKLELFARHVGDRWLFYVREKRFDQWEELENPPLEDWLELLDAVKRRINRRLSRPEEEHRLKKVIRERYPDAKL